MRDREGGTPARAGEAPPALLGAPETTDPYERLRRRHLREAEAHLAEHRTRLGWSRRRIELERRARLRAALRHAQEHSRWFRARLAGIDVASATEADLRRVAPMTKDDLMTDFDRIVTDPKLTLDAVERHLAGLTRDAYLQGEYHAVSSGGSSGRRGVFVYDWDGWRTCFLAFFRHLLHRDGAAAPIDMAMLGAGHPTHFSSTLTATFSGACGLRMRLIPVTQPIDEIVAALNALQPAWLNGYPSALHRLVAHAEAGALQISPRLVLSSSEPLLPETRAALGRAWRAPVLSFWGTSEGGPTGAPCPHGGLHLSEDLHIVEPADRAGEPVAPGERASKLFLTNLFNPVLPLIRYELTDELRLLGTQCPCGSAHRLLDDIQGRLDDEFRYPGGVTITRTSSGAASGGSGTSSSTR